MRCGAPGSGLRCCSCLGLDAAPGVSGEATLKAPWQEGLLRAAHSLCPRLTLARPAGYTLPERRARRGWSHTCHHPGHAAPLRRPKQPPPGHGLRLRKASPGSATATATCPALADRLHHGWKSASPLHHCPMGRPSTCVVTQAPARTRPILCLRGRLGAGPFPILLPPVGLTAASAAGRRRPTPLTARIFPNFAAPVAEGRSPVRCTQG